MPIHGRRIVSIVDDDTSVRRALGNLLGSAGFEVKAFESAEAFLESGDRESAGSLVLDLRLPGMSGLDLLTRLTAAGSPNRVIILTAHNGDEARQQCLQAGAVAFLGKPFQSAALLDALRPAESPSPIQFACGTLGRHRHICAFFNGAEEEHRVLRSFISEGLECGDKGFHIVDSDLRDDYLKRLAESGVDVEGTTASGQLEVVPWQEAYLRGNRFDQDAMLALIEEVLQSGAAAGYPLTRLVAHMEWALLDRPGADDLLEYETRLNHVLPKYDDAVICAYDLSKFSASVAMDAMRTHPAVIIGGVLHENPFFVPPDQFLHEIRERRSARTSASLAG